MRAQEWRTTSPSWPAGVSCSTVPPPRSTSTSSGGSTTSWPQVREQPRERVRAASVDRGLEGCPERAPEQGKPERARLLLAAPALRLPVRTGTRPHAHRDGTARAPLAGLHPGGSTRVRSDLSGRARERLLGGARPRARGPVRHLPGQARGQRTPHGGGRSRPPDPLRRLLRPRFHGSLAGLGARAGARHAGPRRRRHAVRCPHRAASRARAFVSRAAAACRRAGPAGRGDGDRECAHRPASRGCLALAHAPRSGRRRLRCHRPAHLRIRAGRLMAVRVLGWLAVVALLAGLGAAFGYAPREAVQGNVQRIMYLHVPAVLTAYLAFGLVFVGSLGYLLTRRPGWDRLALAAAEPGVIFTGITIASGSIWGKPTWGTWWTWDARLTSTAVLFLVYVGYLLLRGMIDEPDRRARAAAVVGILGAANIPIVHFSVKWWRALHQPSTILGPEPSPIAAPIALALFVNWVAFTLLLFYLLAKRTEIARLEDMHAG